MTEENKEVPTDSSQAWQLLKVSTVALGATLSGYYVGANEHVLRNISAACQHFYHLASTANTDPTAVDAITTAGLTCDHTRSFTSVIGACAGFFTGACGAVCLGCSRRKARKRHRQELEENDDDVVPLPRPVSDKKQATGKEKVRDDLQKLAQTYECKNSDQLLQRLYEYDDTAVNIFNNYLRGAPNLPAACAAFFNLYIKGLLFFKPLGDVVDPARYNLSNAFEEQNAIIIPGPQGTFHIVRPNGTLLQKLTAQQVQNGDLNVLTRIHFLHKATPEAV